MNAAPKVSVIIPVYNTERYLRQCLDSVVNQTLRDIEIICVDDSSTDGSAGILREYAAKDGRITVLTPEKSNPGAARNLGLSIATGEYLSFLDSDDFFEPAMLEHMYACAKNRNADIVVCEMKIYQEETGRIFPVDWHIRKSLLPAETVFSFCDIKRDAFRCIVSYVWDKLFKRELVVKNHLRFQSQMLYEDAVFVYSAMMSAETITVIDDYLVYKRRRAAKDSITDTRCLHMDCAHSVLAGLKEYLTGRGLYERYKRDLISYAVDLLRLICLSCQGDPAGEAEMRDKVGLWLGEFDITGHKLTFYFDLPMYQDLLQAIQPKGEAAETASIRRELRRLKKSPLYRCARLSAMLQAGLRRVREKGLRYTVRRIGEKLTGR